MSTFLKFPFENTTFVVQNAIKTENKELSPSLTNTNQEEKQTVKIVIPHPLFIILEDLFYTGLAEIRRNY